MKPEPVPVPLLEMKPEPVPVRSGSAQEEMLRIGKAGWKAYMLFPMMCCFCFRCLTDANCVTDANCETDVPAPKAFVHDWLRVQKNF